MKFPGVSSATSFKNVVMALAAMVRSFFGKRGFGSAAMGYQSHFCLTGLFALPMRYREAMRPAWSLSQPLDYMIFRICAVMSCWDWLHLV